MTYQPVRALESAHADLQARFDALSRDYDRLYDESVAQARLVNRASLDTPPAVIAAARARLEVLHREGARIRQERQSLADQMSKIMSELSPARQQLREARRALEYLNTADPNDSAVVVLGLGQIKQEQQRLKKLISQLEA
jgi:multidrug resistance efflux pump